MEIHELINLIVNDIDFNKPVISLDKLPQDIIELIFKCSNLNLQDIFSCNTEFSKFSDTLARLSKVDISQLDSTLTNGLYKFVKYISLCPYTVKTSIKYFPQFTRHFISKEIIFLLDLQNDTPLDYKYYYRIINCTIVSIILYEDIYIRSSIHAFHHRYFCDLNRIINSIIVPEQSYENCNILLSRSFLLLCLLSSSTSLSTFFTEDYRSSSDAHNLIHRLQSLESLSVSIKSNDKLCSKFDLFLIKMFQSFGILQKLPYEYCNIILSEVYPSPFVQTKTFINTTAKMLQLYHTGINCMLLYGESGSGITTLINNLSHILYNHHDIITLHLDDSDYQSLIGNWTSSSTNKLFKFEYGLLTKAMLKGNWIIVEGIDKCHEDIRVLLKEIIQTGSLFIRDTNETIYLHPNFFIFATYNTASGQKSDIHNEISFTSFWPTLFVPPLTLEDLDMIISNSFPGLLSVKNIIFEAYVECLHFMDTINIDKKPRLCDILKICKRLSNLTKSNPLVDRPTSRLDSYLLEYTREMILISAESVLFGYIPNKQLRLEIAIHWGGHFQLNPSQVEYILFKSRFEPPKSWLSKPSLDCSYGLTNSHSRYIRQILEALFANESILLLGDTGVGKTTLVQTLATYLNKSLSVYIFSDQSESNDLLGSYYPHGINYKFNQLLKKATYAISLTCSPDSLSINFVDSLNIMIRNSMYNEFIHTLNEFIPFASKFDIWKDIQHELNVLANEVNYTCPKTGLIDFPTVLDFIIPSSPNYYIDTVDESQPITFKFQDGILTKCMRNGGWVLLDELNLAPKHLLQRLVGIIRPTTNSNSTRKFDLYENGELIDIHPDFRLFACINPSKVTSGSHVEYSGKKDLPINLLHMFIEIYIDEIDDNDDLSIIVSSFFPQHKQIVDSIVKFYIGILEMTKSFTLKCNDKSLPVYSLRNFTRALRYTQNILNTSNTNFIIALRDGILSSFCTLLSIESERIVMNFFDSIFEFHPIDGFSYTYESTDDFIITNTVRSNLVKLTRLLKGLNVPILLQGPTSSGKTKLIEYLAKQFNRKLIRINNHENTDLQEYMGSFVFNRFDSQIEFVEGSLVQAARNGYWLLLDELNLAPSEVLEALNRILDDNREIIIPETGKVVKPHKNFIIFATQNPANSIYGGRKQLSRALLNRFVQFNIPEIQFNELEEIIHHRFKLPPSRSSSIINVYRDLYYFSPPDMALFGSTLSITSRDIIKWCSRNPSDDNELISIGWLILGERQRTSYARDNVLAILKKHIPHGSLSIDYIKSDIVSNAIRSFPKFVVTEFSARLLTLLWEGIKANEPLLLIGETGIGKTYTSQIIANLFGVEITIVNLHLHTDCSELIGSVKPCSLHFTTYKESLDLLITLLLEFKNTLISGEIGNDTIDQLGDITDYLTKFEEIPSMEDYKTFSGIINDIILHVNQNLRPIKKPFNDLSTRIKQLLSKLSPMVKFEWKDGPVVNAMRKGHLLILDEISLAEDSVLEKLNPILEGGSPSLVLNDKVSSDIEVVKAHEKFRIIATMNPGGDFGKRELSPALSNRFTQIYVLDITVDSPEFYKFISILSSKIGSDRDDLPDIILSILNALVKYNIKASLRDLVILIEYCKSNWDDSGYTLYDAFRMLFTFPLLPAKSFQVDGCIHATLRSFGLLDDSGSADMLLDEKIEKAIDMKRFVLLEGPAGVGKTTSITNIANNNSIKLIKVVISEQTELLDLVGSFVPCENKKGRFKWVDGPLVNAMTNGYWILLDELNLAPQPVIEGLNSLLDHRRQIFISDINKTVKCHENFFIFASQNCAYDGGGRKFLPKSLMNRFTIINTQPLSYNDCFEILLSKYPSSDIQALSYIAESVYELNETFSNSGYTFNIRDCIRLASITTRNGLDRFNLFSCLLSRFKSETEYQSAKQILGLKQFPLEDIRLNGAQLLGFQNHLINLIERFIDLPISIVVNGKDQSGKTTAIKYLAKKHNVKLVEIPVYPSSDVYDLLGSYQQSNTNDSDLDFKWVDGMIIDAMRKGDWVLIKRVDLAQPAILDRLNNILEFDMKNQPNFLLFESGSYTTIPVNWGVPSNKGRGFKIFMTNSYNSSLAKPILNRCVELNIDFFDLIESDSFIRPFLNDVFNKLGIQKSNRVETYFINSLKCLFGMYSIDNLESLLYISILFAILSDRMDHFNISTLSLWGKLFSNTSIDFIKESVSSHYLSDMNYGFDIDTSFGFVRFIGYLYMNNHSIDYKGYLSYLIASAKFNRIYAAICIIKFLFGLDDIKDLEYNKINLQEHESKLLSLLFEPPEDDALDESRNLFLSGVSSQFYMDINWRCFATRGYGFRSLVHYRHIADILVRYMNLNITQSSYRDILYVYTTLYKSYIHPNQDFNESELIEKLLNNRSDVANQAPNSIYSIVNSRIIVDLGLRYNSIISINNILDALPYIDRDLISCIALIEATKYNPNYNISIEGMDELPPIPGFEEFYKSFMMHINHPGHKRIQYSFVMELYLLILKNVLNLYTKHINIDNEIMTNPNQFKPMYGFLYNTAYYYLDPISLNIDSIAKAISKWFNINIKGNRSSNIWIKLAKYILTPNYIDVIETYCAFDLKSSDYISEITYWEERFGDFLYEYANISQLTDPHTDLEYLFDKTQLKSYKHYLSLITTNKNIDQELLDKFGMNINRYDIEALNNIKKTFIEFSGVYLVKYFERDVSQSELIGIINTTIEFLKTCEHENPYAIKFIKPLQFGFYSALLSLPLLHNTSPNAMIEYPFVSVTSKLLESLPSDNVKVESLNSLINWSIRERDWESLYKLYEMYLNAEKTDEEFLNYRQSNLQSAIEQLDSSDDLIAQFFPLPVEFDFMNTNEDLKRNELADKDTHSIEIGMNKPMSVLLTDTYKLTYKTGMVFRGISSWLCRLLVIPRDSELYNMFVSGVKLVENGIRSIYNDGGSDLESVGYLESLLNKLDKILETDARALNHNSMLHIIDSVQESLMHYNKYSTSQLYIPEFTAAVEGIGVEFIKSLVDLPGNKYNELVSGLDVLIVDLLHTVVTSNDVYSDIIAFLGSRLYEINYKLDILQLVYNVISGRDEHKAAIISNIYLMYRNLALSSKAKCESIIAEAKKTILYISGSGRDKNRIEKVKQSVSRVMSGFIKKISVPIELDLDKIIFNYEPKDSEILSLINYIDESMNGGDRVVMERCLKELRVYVKSLLSLSSYSASGFDITISLPLLDIDHNPYNIHSDCMVELIKIYQKGLPDDQLFKKFVSISQNRVVESFMNSVLEHFNLSSGISWDSFANVYTNFTAIRNGLELLAELCDEAKPLYESVKSAYDDVQKTIEVSMINSHFVTDKSEWTVSTDHMILTTLNSAIDKLAELRTKSNNFNINTMIDKLLQFSIKEIKSDNESKQIINQLEGSDVCSLVLLCNKYYKLICKINEPISSEIISKDVEMRDQWISGMGASADAEAADSNAKEERQASGEDDGEEDGVSFTDDGSPNSKGAAPVDDGGVNSDGGSGDDGKHGSECASPDDVEMDEGLDQMGNDEININENPERSEDDPVLSNSAEESVSPSPIELDDNTCDELTAQEPENNNIEKEHEPEPEHEETQEGGGTPSQPVESITIEQNNDEIDGAGEQTSMDQNTEMKHMHSDAVDPSDVQALNNAQVPVNSDKQDNTEIFDNIGENMVEDDIDVDIEAPESYNEQSQLNNDLDLTIEESAVRKKRSDINLNDCTPRTFEFNHDWANLMEETSAPAIALGEQLKKILEPTIKGRLQGAYKSGKRLSMRKVMLFVASGYKKDKIWLRRNRLSKFGHYIILALDNSASMIQSDSGNSLAAVALRSLSLLTQAFDRAEVGNICIYSFGSGEPKEIVSMGKKINKQIGDKLVKSFTFTETSDDSHQKGLANMLEEADKVASSIIEENSRKILIIITDGRFNKKIVEPYVQRLINARVTPVLIIIDNNEDGKELIINMKQVVQEEGNIKIESFFHDFPFPLYSIIQKIEDVPNVLCNLIRCAEYI